MANEGYDIIILAGQSNGDGFGVTYTPQTYDDRIFLLQDKKLISIYGKLDIDYDTFHNDLYPADITVDHCYERKDEQFYRGCLAYSFANEYVSRGLLANNRKLLIVKGAVGGTNFFKNQWGLSNKLYDRLCQMTNYALSLDGQNKIVAVLWHQGESDTDNAKSTPQEKYDFYYHKLYAMVTDYQNKYDLQDVPFICGEFAPPFINLRKDGCNAVLTATKDVCSKLKRATLVSSDNLLTNKAEMGIDDDIHFGYKSLIEFGKRYFDAFTKLTTNKTV